MDYDDDGRTDIITGSYTGQLYLFRRQADGRFASREELRNAAGEVLLMPDHSVVPELVDMDADGDLDLVVGARIDPARVVENLGSRAEPVWSTDDTWLKTEAGEQIVGSNAHHADWDGDGIPDLLVGSEFGWVRWYRNAGEADAPRYESARELIPKAEFGRDPEGTIPTRPGLRLKVHVTDWNGDGRADLLVGDVTWQSSPPEPLTAEETAQKARLEARIEELEGRYRRRGASAEERQEIVAAINEIRRELHTYDRRKTHSHGWVWLYLRKGEAAKARR